MRRRDDPAQAELARRVTDMATLMTSSQAVLTDRLGQIEQTSQSAQDVLATRLNEQEKKLTAELNQRLDAIQQRVGNSLQESTKQTLETMGKVQERLAVIDEAQRNIATLGSQIVGLQDILSNKQSRGAFGELQLNDLVRTILPPSAYRFQATLSNGNRADCLLDLPNPPGSIVVDAKFPLDGYRALRDATTHDDTLKAQRQFRDDITKHIRDIAEKYILAGETAESAIMFLPSEAVYAELHANFEAVVEDSYRHRVFIVSPTTLMATLNTIRAVLKDARMREQAGVIQHELTRMLDDVRRLGERVEKLDRHFNQAGEDVRQIRISTDKIAGKAEKIAELEMEEESDEAVVAGPRLVGQSDGD
ncbi:MAG: DNA recombination protein RmuC [Rhodospirillales bacterium]|nr:DNA recombination protein RmuC [Rhodospirillales bacterium]